MGKQDEAPCLMRRSGRGPHAPGPGAAEGVDPVENG
jgi:hypothetical protein